MDALCFDDNKEGIEVKCAEGSPTSDFSNIRCGDQQVVPRVGDQYQAEIPSLTAAPHLSELIKKLRDSDKPESISMGSHIPLIRPHCKFHSSFETLECVTSEEGQLIAENEQKVEGFSNLQSSFKFDETVIDSIPEVKTEPDQLRGLYLLPGSSSDQSWTDIQRNSFLLGLYAFGKNLNSLKRFVGSKNMGDILSFYYGKFYRSEGYCKWSKCRKLRANRRIYGQKIFTGWRQQELLSRLSSHVSSDCQTMLVELSRNFGEGKMPFEEYLFALKDAVGIDLLTAAVGIGKGKEDLTVAKKTKTKHIFSVRPEIPNGKAGSSLTSADIIKFLTGDFRLCKARSSDLFWEAVWPRLIAEGWHSEQPKDHVVSGSRQSLVFLVPGIKKFSRRLVKGNQYFDSISDVLNKVASDPRLIEMEIQATEGNADRENIEDKQDLDGLSNKQQFCYLQPLSSKCQDPMKFTIVDTSIVFDLDKCKVRQLRSSPFQILSISAISSHSSGSKQGASQETEDQAEQASSSNPVEEFSDKRVKIESPDCTHIHEVLNTCKEEKPSREINEYPFFQNVMSDCSKYLAPFVKKQKLTAGNRGEFGDCTESTSVEKKLDPNESTSSSYHCGESESSPDLSNESSAIENHMVREVPAEETETKVLLDLNLPLIAPDLEVEMEVPSSMVIVQDNNNQCENTPCSSYEVTQLNEIEEFPDGHEGRQPIIFNRRQSTRNRPLTRKALEALECRFVNSKRKRRNSESSHNNSKSQGDNSIGNAMPCISAEKENVIQEYSSSINLNNEANYDL